MEELKLLPAPLKTSHVLFWGLGDKSSPLLGLDIHDQGDVTLNQRKGEKTNMSRVFVAHHRVFYSEETEENSINCGQKSKGRFLK